MQNSSFEAFSKLYFIQNLIKYAFKQGKMMKIAIIRLSALGDIIQTSIVLQFIKRHFGDAQIDWVCEERFCAILERCNEINSLIKINLKDKKIIKSVKILLNARKNGYDLAIDFQGLIKSAIVAKLIAKNVCGFDKFSARESLAAAFYTKKLSCDYNENIIIRNLALASFALGFKFSADEILQKTPCFKTGAILQKTPKKRILIAPFASEKSKIYTKFSDVALGLKDCEIFICFGSESERVKAQKIAEISHSNLLRKMDLKALCDFLGSCDLVIGNDSAITHLAWAQNLATITLFGNRPSVRNAFKTPKNRVIDVKKNIDARKINKNDFCINEISAQGVVNLALEMLIENEKESKK